MVEAGRGGGGGGGGGGNELYSTKRDYDGRFETWASMSSQGRHGLVSLFRQCPTGEIARIVRGLSSDRILPSSGVSVRPGAFPLAVRIGREYLEFSSADRSGEVNGIVSGLWRDGRGWPLTSGNCISE